jgi:predicted RNA binding protein YcfA (HicA-like mRNA interferase family)
MPPLPTVTGLRLVKALEAAGFAHARTRGSHYIMRHPDGRGTTVPVHGRTNVPKGTLRGILRDTGLSVAELEKLL